MVDTFQVGQRWYSYTESELGLGVVTELVNRQVVVSFPATGDERIYAQNNAPLSRIVYALGDSVTDDEGVCITVERHEETTGCVIYVGTDHHGTEQMIHEASLESSVHFSRPYERLFAGQIDKLRDYTLRQDTLKYLHLHQQSSAYGFLGPRVQFLPHQFYIASEVGQRIAPRVLLADEVGLGKTIEAGLILHQQLIKGLANRVLVVVPDNLIHQWLVEMLRRFNLHFSILDEGRCSEAEDNPFESTQLALVPLSVLTQKEERLNQAVSAGWDLMVVDEAHHLEWSESAVSHAYQCVESLAQNTRGLLLLTATPEQLGIESHFARLRLLDPDRYYDLERFKNEESNFHRVNQLIQTLNDHDAFNEQKNDPALFALMEKYLGENAAQQLLSADTNSDDYSHLIQRSVQALLDQHGTGRVLFRNTRDSVKGFPERKLHTYALDLPDEYVGYMAEACLTDQLHPERLLSDESDSSWLLVDNRADWLIQWLNHHSFEKVLVICAHADTAITLEKQLRLFEGRRTALFHEGMSLIERDRAAAYFAESDQGAQLLICSEIGSEGRNFQFAHHMVMFDLPMVPDLLEQRIGRLDRIGQLQDVNIHVPYFKSSAQHVLLRWYAEGLGAFERVCPTGQLLMQRFAQGLKRCMENPTDDLALEQLLKETEQAQTALLNELQEGRDRLLELNSCNEDKANELLEEVDSLSQPGPLSAYMGRIFDHFGVEQESTGISGVVLHPGDHMLTGHFPALPSDGMTATFQRSEALSREDMHFLSWEHPMVQGAMEMMLEGNYGSASLCTMKLLPLKAGSLLIEGIFRVHCISDRSLQLQRYLPDACIRRVIDSNGNDLTHVITEQHFENLGKRVPKGVAFNLVKHARDDISGLIDKLEDQVMDLESALLTQATESLQQQFDVEKQRLIALAKVNPNIRAEELDALDTLQAKLEDSLSSASLKMDAIRVAVVTHE